MSALAFSDILIRRIDEQKHFFDFSFSDASSFSLKSIHFKIFSIKLEVWLITIIAGQH